MLVVLPLAAVLFDADDVPLSVAWLLAVPVLSAALEVPLELVMLSAESVVPAAVEVSPVAAALLVAFASRLE